MMITAPVVRAHSSKVTVAIATVVLFGTPGIFIYPLLWHLASEAFPAITKTSWGIFTGSTLHEVAQVVAAGHTVSPETESAAVIAKMLRVMMLAPFLLLLSAKIQRGKTPAEKQANNIAFPWFAPIFILVALFNSLHLLPQAVIDSLNQLDNLLLTTAMAALGLTTRFSALKQTGLKPLLLGALLFGWLIIGGGAINLVFQHLLT
ncbi:hypothetical protein ETR_22149 [Erwinia tracheiphila PSU-1]|nr:hypothetical protein ETR_22149 [Erwinia tracheiphila PSU-1]